MESEIGILQKKKKKKKRGGQYAINFLCNEILMTRLVWLIYGATLWLLLKLGVSV